MASRILQILFIVVVLLVLVLVEADRYRRDDSSRGSSSSSGRPMRRRPRPTSRRTQTDQRNGRPNGVRGPGPRGTNERVEGRNNPTSQTRGTNVRNNKKPNPNKKHPAKGGSRVPESIPRTNAKTSPSSRKQSTPRRNSPMKDRNNNVGGKKIKTPAESNKKRQIARPRTNKRSSDSLSSGCCSSSGDKGSEQVPPITPPTKSPIAGDPPVRSIEESQETLTSRDDDDGGRDHSKEYPKQTEGPRGNDSEEDETTKDDEGEDGEGKGEETEDDVTTVDDSVGYTIPTEIATVTTVTEFTTSNNTVTETTTPRHRDVTETTIVRHSDVTETTTPPNRDVTETTTPTTDVLPPLPVRRERSIVFCAADRQRGVSKCPCTEKIPLPVLPQFPVTECKFRKPNDIAIPIGINAFEANGKNNPSRTSAAYFITIVALLIVSFTV